MKNLTSVTLAIVLASCGKASQGSPVDVRAIEAQLDSIEIVFTAGRPMAAMLEEYVGFFAARTVLLPPGGDPVRGREAVLAFYTDGFEGFELVSLEYRSPDVLLDGDLAVRRYEGTARVVSGEPSDTLELQNRYIDVLQRDDESQWRIVWHTWSPIDE